MIGFVKDIKIQSFIKKLSKSIEKYNESGKEFEITSSTIKSKWASSKSKLKHRIVFEIELAEKNHIYFYNLRKEVDIPFKIDVADMTIEKVVFDVEELERMLNSEYISKYEIVKSKRSFIEYPTIFAKLDRGTVAGGFEIDYIYPVVKQNTNDSLISDIELNDMIQSSKPFTNFIKTHSNVEGKH